MKKIIFLAFLWASSFSVAQNFDHQASFDEIQDALKATANYHLKSPIGQAPSLFRPTEDTADFAYVLMSSAELTDEVANLRKTIAQNLPANVKLVILANTSETESIQRKYSQWISPDRLIVAHDRNTDSGFWARDSFPVPVYENSNKKLTLVNAKYYRPFDSGDAVAGSLGVKNLKKDFTFVGGNLIADEDGNCFSVNSYRLFGTNSTDIIQAYGCKTHHLMKHVSGIGDVDEVLKPLSGKRILTNTVAYKKDLESWGYQVILLPELKGSYKTYANSLIVGKVAFMPVFDLPTDKQARQVYENLGYQVVEIPTPDLSENMHGSIHCQTMAYPAINLKDLMAALQLE